MENIVLIGMPGCGKSTIGALLAAQLGKKFVDADERIVTSYGMTIPAIFDIMGEAGFRKLEHEALSDLGKQSGLVIATGGGCVTRRENYPLLHQNGTIIWIKRNIDALPTEGRPLSHKERMQSMYEIRKPMYGAFADYSINNDRTPADAVAHIVELERKL